MSDIGWGCLSESEGYGTLGDNVDDYHELSPKESLLPTYASYKHASHGMIFARKNSKLWDLYDMKGLVMMQLRFDGVLGFPGGLVDPGENPLDGINREMHEEICLDLTKNKFTEENHAQAYVHEGKNLVLHFYIMEVSVETFCDLEKETLSALEFGIETYGIIRVPLFTMGDGLRGFPAFLANQFAGNAKGELIKGLIQAKLLSQSEMEVALKACKNFKQGQ